MFLTITINTDKKEKAVRLKRTKFQTTKGWRSPMVRREQGFWERMKMWRRLRRPMPYTIEKQAAMF